MTGKKVFSLANPTAPTAEPQVAPAVTSRRPDVPTSRPEPREGRSAFTWRQTLDQQDALDELVRSARRAAGRRVDKADVLAALVALANSDEAVRAALVAQLDA